MKCHPLALGCEDIIFHDEDWEFRRKCRNLTDNGCLMSQSLFLFWHFIPSLVQVLPLESNLSYVHQCTKELNIDRMGNNVA